MALDPWMLQQYMKARHADLISNTSALPSSELVRRGCDPNTLSLAVDAWKSLNNRPFMRWTNALQPVSILPESASIYQVAEHDGRGGWDGTGRDGMGKERIHPWTDGLSECLTK